MEANRGFWEKWLDGARESLTNFDQMAANVVDRFSDQFGDAFEAIILDAKDAGDVFQGMAEGMVRATGITSDRSLVSSNCRSIRAGVQRTQIERRSVTRTEEQQTARRT